MSVPLPAGFRLVSTDPTARWMWAAAASGANVWACFRGHLHLDATPLHAPALVAVDSKYWLWVNGALVVREGGLKRGPTPDDGYADELDLAPWLRAGDNLVAVLAWHFGADGASHRSSGQPAMLVQIAAAGRLLASGAGWKARRHPAFGQGGEPPTVTLAEHGLDVDLAHDDAWHQPGFDDRAWAPALDLGAPPAAPWGRLVARPIPAWADGEPKTAAGLPCTGPGKFEADLPANQQAYPWVDATLPAGAVLRCGLDRGRTSVRLTGDGTRRRWESPAWLNGQRLWVELPAGATLHAAGWRPTGYASAETGSFVCSDPDLARLWSKSVTTLRLCMRDNWMDCPDRERSQWIGDVANMVELAHYALDPAAAALTAKCLRELVAWRTAEGELWSAVPTGRFRGTFRSFPAQVMAALATALGEHWLHGGDRALLAEVYPAVRDWLLDLHRCGPDGLVEHRGPWGETRWEPGLQAWYDWGGAQDQALMDQGWYAWAMRTLARLAQAVGERGDAAEARARHAGIAGGLQAWWDEAAGAYRAPGCPHPADDRGNALAVLAGLVPDDRHQALARLLSERQESSIYMEPRVLDALFALGRGDLALARLRRRFVREIASPCTTLPESFGEDSNHGWGAAVAAVMARRLGGLAPLAPGWKAALLAPSRHGPERVEVISHGFRVEIRRAAQWRITLAVPAGTTLRIALPAGMRLEADGSPADGIVGGGIWTFTAVADGAGP
ncbi:MAG: hypothetical protein L6R48_12535 [Planctomycetes bacterium]|nr:hypothetical protein [Planctomycetota bacterium]